MPASEKLSDQSTLLQSLIYLFNIIYDYGNNLASKIINIIIANVDFRGVLKC